MAVVPVTDLELSFRRLVNVYGHGHLPFVGQWVEKVCVGLGFCREGVRVCNTKSPGSTCRRTAKGV